MASRAAVTDPDEEEFIEQHIRMRNNSSEESGPRSAKKHVWTKEGQGVVTTNSPVIPT
jgi:hypothetical protein